MSSDDEGSLGSDFGVLEDSYEVDSDGNPMNAPPAAGETKKPS
jgi:hypothetical protein